MLTTESRHTDMKHSPSPIGHVPHKGPYLGGGNILYGGGGAGGAYVVFVWCQMGWFLLQL